MRLVIAAAALALAAGAASAQTYPDKPIHVIVAGAFRKRDGKLLCPGLGAIRNKLAASGERILGRLNVPSVSRLIASQ